MVPVEYAYYFIPRRHYCASSALSECPPRLFAARKELTWGEAEKLIGDGWGAIYKAFSTQTVVIPVAERNLDYAQKVGDELAAAGFRAEVDERQERMNAKLRDAQLQKIPYMLVVGNREEEARGVSVRLRTNENRGMTDLAEFVEHLREVVGTKSGL